MVEDLFNETSIQGNWLHLVDVDKVRTDVKLQLQRQISCWSWVSSEKKRQVFLTFAMKHMDMFLDVVASPDETQPFSHKKFNSMLSLFVASDRL